MTRSEIETRLHDLIREQAGEPVEHIRADMSFQDDLGMDSLTTVDLVSDVEAAFAIEVPDSELSRMVLVTDLVEFVVKANGGS